MNIILVKDVLWIKIFKKVWRDPSDEVFWIGSQAPAGGESGSLKVFFKLQQEIFWRIGQIKFILLNVYNLVFCKERRLAS